MKSHRGLSAVVGTVFLIAVVVGSLSYVTYSLEMMGNFSESLIVEESRQQAKQMESFEITSVDVTPANKLDGIIKNSGDIPLEISTVYIDEQGVNDVVQKFTINTQISPGNTEKLIDLLDFDIDPNKGYTLKVSTSRGSSETFYINSPSSDNLIMDIRAVPEFLPSEFTTTVLFSVVNNMSNNNILYNITPVLDMTDLTGTSVGEYRSGPNPPSYPALGPGEIAIFEYIYKLTGNADDSVNFNATISNANAGNFVQTQAIIKEVTVATQAGTAIESYGLSNQLTQYDDILFLHDENNLTPNNEYHMDTSEASGGGITWNPRNGDIIHMTANVTSDTIITNGTFNLRFAYWSELSSPNVPEPDMAFHFTCNNCGDADNTPESTGTIDGEELDKVGTVSWFSDGGPDNDAYYTLDGSNDRLEAQDGWHIDHDFGDVADIKTKPVTTAVWFRVDHASDSDYDPIVRWGNEADSSDDEYEIALGDGDSASHGHIIYRYTTNIDDDETKCESPGTYDDGRWHFAVGARDGDDDCKLYMDGVLVDDVEECNGCADTGSVDMSSHDEDLYIGYNGNGAELDGDVASFMHWDNLELSASQIEDLYHTNFGDNGTRVNWSLYRTNGVGVNQETIFTDTFELPFADPAANGDSRNLYFASDSDSIVEKYSFNNATFTTIANVTLTTGDRLKSVISWPGDNQNLDINIRFDDDDAKFELPDASTFIQTPEVDPLLPTFIIIDNDDELEYMIFNNGPAGAWFTYQGTRFVITLPDGTASYAGIIKQINGSDVSSIQDSIFIPDQNFALLKFEKISNPPQLNAPGGARAPPDDYNAAIFLSGFDDRGETFLRTINIGFVHVVE